MRGAQRLVTLLQICLLAWLLVGEVRAARGNLGACVHHNYTDIDVDFAKFQGKWYNIWFSGSYKGYPADSRCTILDYSGPSSSRLTITQYNYLSTEVYSIQKAKAHIVGKGHLKVQTSTWNLFRQNYEVVYLNRDSSVAVLAGCNGWWKLGQSNIWVMARDFNYSEYEVYQALQFIKQQGFEDSDLTFNPISLCAKV